MRGILAAEIAVFFLVALSGLPVRAEFLRETGALSVRLRLACFPLPARGGGKNPALTRYLLQNAYTILGREIPRLRVEILKLHVTAGGDPAAAALAYGAAGVLLEPLAQRVPGAVRIEAALDGRASDVTLHLRLTLRLYRVLTEAARLCVWLLRERLRKGRGDASYKNR